VNRRRFLVTVAVSFLAAGCGIPTEVSPRDIADRDEPVDLVRPQPSPDLGTTDDSPVIFLVGGENEERLVEAPRTLPPGNVNAFVRALLASPTQVELDDGLRSAFSKDLAFVNTANLADGVVLVRFTLADEGVGFEGPDAVKALAQLVYTLSELNGLNGVQVEINDELQTLLDEDGAPVERALTRADFRSFRPLPPPTTTTTTTSTTSTTTTTRPTTSTTRRRPTTTTSTSTTTVPAAQIDQSAPPTTAPVTTSQGSS
jgi:hypothetical protein